MSDGVTNDDLNNMLKSFNDNEGVDHPPVKKLKTHNFHYENYSQPFILLKPTYTQQYSNIYNLRIKTLRGLLMKTIEQEKAKDVKGNEEYQVLDFLKEIKANEKCYCIGTMFKKMNLRPSILNEYVSTTGVTSTITTNSQKKGAEEEEEERIVNFTHEEDVIFLEDETARLKLEGNLNYDDYVTGLTIIVKGSGMSNGSLHVEEIIFSYLPKLHIPPPVTTENRYVLFVSGLCLKETSKNIQSVTLLRNFILGISGDKHISDHLIRVVILGNSLNDAMEGKTGNGSSATTANAIGSGTETETGTESDVDKNINDMDLFIASIGSAVHVDLMPGDKDPSDINLPQQPLPSVFFKKARNFNSFQCVTNPYTFSIDNVNICCMSGEPVNNICAYSKNGNIESLQLIAKSRILSPTSPDTLGCYPFTENDPFCLCDDKKYPHIFVSGNSESLEVNGLIPAPSLAAPTSGESLEIVKLPLLICLPNFLRIPKVVIVNLKNMDHKILSFEIDL